jgi:hypothetical protein
MGSIVLVWILLRHFEKVKVKLSLCITASASWKMYGGEEVYLHFGTGWR